MFDFFFRISTNIYVGSKRANLLIETSIKNRRVNMFNVINIIWLVVVSTVNIFSRLAYVSSPPPHLSTSVSLI